MLDWSTASRCPVLHHSTTPVLQPKYYEFGSALRWCRSRKHAPASGVDSDSPAGWLASGGLPHAVSWFRARSRRAAGISILRRRSLHRLERDRASADALRQGLQRRPGSYGVVSARLEPVGGFWLTRQEAIRRNRICHGAGARFEPAREPHRGDLLWRQRRRGDSAAKRPPSRPARPSQNAFPTRT